MLKFSRERGRREVTRLPVDLPQGPGSKSSYGFFGVGLMQASPSPPTLAALAERRPLRPGSLCYRGCPLLALSRPGEGHYAQGQHWRVRLLSLFPFVIGERSDLGPHANPLLVSHGAPHAYLHFLTRDLAPICYQNVTVGELFGLIRGWPRNKRRSHSRI